MSDEILLDIEEEPTNLADALDRMLHRGVVLQGEIMISVAEIDLLYLDLRLFLSSVDRAMDAGALSAAPLSRVTSDKDGGP